MSQAKIDQVCEHCGGLFRKPRKQRFCSARCGYDARMVKPLLFCCQQCGAFFNLDTDQVGKGYRKFCGTECQAKAMEKPKPCKMCGTSIPTSESSCCSQCREFSDKWGQVVKAAFEKTWSGTIPRLYRRARERQRRRVWRRENPWQAKCMTWANTLRTRPKPKPKKENVVLRFSWENSLHLAHKRARS